MYDAEGVHCSNFYTKLYSDCNMIQAILCALLRSARRMCIIMYGNACTRSVRKVSDRIFLCEHLMDYNLARLHEPTLNLSAHA